VNGTETSPLFEKEIKQIACGGNHTAILSSDNELYLCGFNQKGELGLKIKDKLLNEFRKLENFTFPIHSIACGWNNHTSLLTQDMQIYTTSLGRFGSKTTFEVAPLPLVDESIDQLIVGSSADSILVVTSSKKIYGTGKNRNCQLGLPDHKDKDKFELLPIKCSNNGRIVHAANGGYLTVIVVDGDVELQDVSSMIPAVHKTQLTEEEEEQEQERKLQEKRNQTVLKLKERAMKPKKTASKSKKSTSTTSSSKLKQQQHAPSKVIIARKNPNIK
jgi:alpha-tubulin suppressor-like RCC1 family protein